MAETSTTPTVQRIRITAARVIQLVCVAIAVIIVIAIVTVAARNNINADNVLVRFVKGVANTFDGPFSRKGGIFSFSGDSAETRNALVNWGIAAGVWLVIGRVVSAVVRP